MAVPGVSAGEVLVRVRACGVCRTDLHVVSAEDRVRRDDRDPLDLRLCDEHPIEWVAMDRRQARHL